MALEQSSAKIVLWFREATWERTKEYIAVKFED
jgi:hypothetical protein